MSSYPPPTTGAIIASLIVLLLDLGKRFGILGKTLQMGPFALFGDIPESMECQSPLAQVDRNSMTWWPAGGWVWSAPRNLVTNLPFFFLSFYYFFFLFFFSFFFFFFHCTIQQRRIAVQYSVIVEGNLMLCHQHHPHYDHFAVTINFTKMQWWYSMGMILVDSIQMVVTYCMSYHHRELTRGRTQSYHHIDVTHRRTVNMSLCPTTTWT